MRAGEAYHLVSEEGNDGCSYVSDAGLSGLSTGAICLVGVGEVVAYRQQTTVRP